MTINARHIWGGGTTEETNVCPSEERSGCTTCTIGPQSNSSLECGINGSLECDSNAGPGN